MKLNLRRPVPLWLFLVGLLLVGSVAAGMAFLPTVLGPKQDFTVDLSPAQQTVITEPGQISSSAVNVKSLHGFIGKVSLTAQVPNGVTALFNAAPPYSAGTSSSSEVILGSDNALLGLNATTFIHLSTIYVGNFSISVVATSGSISHAATLHLTSQDVGIDLSPQSLVVQQGSSVASSLVLTSLNGFTGNLSLSASPNFYNPFAYASANLANMVVPAHGVATKNFVVTSPDFATPKNGNVTLTFDLSNTVTHVIWARTVNVQVTQAPESLAFPSYVPNSPSNATLFIRNDGPAAVKFLQLNVTDGLGNTYSSCLIGYMYCWGSPQINATNIGVLNLLVGTLCTSSPRCQLYGNQFTFQTGHSYTVTVQTSRYNLFTKVISF